LSDHANLSIHPLQTDWLEAEIDTYLEAHTDSSKAVVIDFGDVFATSPHHPIARKLAHFIRITEAGSALGKAPRAKVVDAIPLQLAGRRRDRIRLRVFQAIGGALAALAVGLGWQFIEARAQRDAALENEARALAAVSQTVLESNPTQALKLALGLAAKLIHTRKRRRLCRPFGVL